eukprot:m.150519 g.150519  ORF g.150519 m.150519 type:complete len:95 (-) comp9746_c0_seq3:71-355(-)
MITIADETICHVLSWLLQSSLKVVVTRSYGQARVLSASYDVMALDSVRKVRGVWPRSVHDDIKRFYGDYVLNFVTFAVRLCHVIQPCLLLLSHP